MWQCKVVAMGETHSANKEPKKGAFIYLHTSIRSSVVKRALWSLHPSIHPTKLKRSQTSAVRHPSFNCPALWRVQKTCAEKWSEMLWNSPPTAFPSRKCVPQSNFPPFAPTTSHNKLYIYMLACQQKSMHSMKKAKKTKKNTHQWHRWCLQCVLS